MITINNLIVHNLLEEIVERMVGRIMETSDMCMCDQCRVDVIALTMNSLPPRYIVTDAGDVFVRFQMYSDQNQVEIIAAMSNAIQKVKERPRHGAV